MEDRVDDTGFNFLLFNGKIYVAGNESGTIVLNANDGSVYKQILSLNSFDVKTIGNYLLFLTEDSISVLDSELESVATFNASSLSSNEFDVWFDDFYFDSENVYILATKQDVQNDIYSPMIYTLSKTLDLIDELSVIYDENQGYLSENGVYSSYCDFIKYGDYFYQIGFDVHRISIDGEDTLIYDEYNYFLYDGNIDSASSAIVVGDKYISFDTSYYYDSQGNYYSYTTVSLNISKEPYTENSNKYVVNYPKLDNSYYYAEKWAWGENVTLTANGLLVKWYDWYTDRYYITEYEFVSEGTCEIIKGSGLNLGDEIRCGAEEFYVISNDGNQVEMLAKYNLMVGRTFDKVMFDQGYSSSTDARNYFISTYTGEYEDFVWIWDDNYDYVGAMPYVWVYDGIQGELAIGAHGDERGNPEFPEVAVVANDWGLSYDTYAAVENLDAVYSGGYYDFELVEYGNTFDYLKHYNNYLSELGVVVNDITIPAVSDVNKWIYEASGINLPLEEWYYDWESVALNDYWDIHIIGDMVDYIPEGYEWIYGTTYWLKTASSIEGYSAKTYFVDTLGQLCNGDACSGVVGAGIRPLVTISLSSIEFNVTTKTDGNGVVEASHSTATSGDSITFTIAPNEGYVLNSVTVTDEHGNDIVYTDYKFTMPAADVVIEAKFDKIVYFEPLISISASSDKNYSVGSVYSYSIYVENPYDFELTDVLVTVDTLGAECLDSNCTKIDDYTFKFDTIRVHNSDRLRLLYTVLEIGTIEINAEILEAYAESPYFLNEDKEYKATSVATTKAGLEICNVLSGTGNGSVNQYYLVGYNDTEIAFSQWIVLQDNACTKIAIPTDVTYRLTQIDKQEYNLEKVTGHITSNGSTFTVEPSTYKVTFYNSYEKKGYFHSWDRKENDIDIYSQPI